MKRHILTVCAIFLASLSFSQTVFWTENFGNGCSQGQAAHGFAGPTGNWVVSFLLPPFPGGDNYYVSATEADMGAGMCSRSCLSTPTLQNRCLHVSVPSNSFICTTGDCGAIYNAAITEDFRAESPAINCTGKSGISLSFEYLEGGQTTFDDGSVYYSIGLGPWILLGNPAKTACANGACTGTIVCNGFSEGVWSTYSVNLPASVNNAANLRIGFRWTSDGDNNGIDPSFAIDNIAVSAATITSIGQTEMNNLGFKVYPNPLKDVLYVETGSLQKVNIEIIDALGRILINESAELKKEQAYKINISQLPEGIYLVRLRSGDQSSAPVKVIKE